jgi:hypothetical protein
VITVQSVTYIHNNLFAAKLISLLPIYAEECSVSDRDNGY